MDPREEWAGHYARLKSEAKKFAALATSARSRAAEQRKARDWLGALNSSLNARRLRDSAASAKSEAAAIKRIWGFR